MAGVNKVILLGNLGSDPELRYFPDGTSMAKVNLATTDVRRGSNNERNEYTEWHRLTFFGRQAEVAGEYLKKGSKIYVEGTLRTRKWEAKEGGTRSMVEIRVLQFQMLDSKGSRPPRDDAAPPGDSGGGSRQGSKESGSQPAKDGGDDPFGAIDQDDIPF